MTALGFLLPLLLALAAACNQVADVTPDTVGNEPKSAAPDRALDTASPEPDVEESFLPVVLSPAEAIAVAHPGIRAAIEDIRARGGTPLDPVQIDRAEQVTWSDPSLGCPIPGMSFAQVLTPGMWLIFTYRGEVLDYRITDTRALLCTQADRREPLDSKPLPGLWATLSPVPTSRSEVAAVQLDGMIYVFGGFGTGSTANEVYDPQTDAWRELSAIPRPLNHAAAVALQGRIYLVGGFDSQFNPIDDLWSYDPGADSWTELKPLPEARGALGAAFVDGKIYAIGGRGRRGDVRTTSVYDPSTNEWSQLGDMPTARDHVATALIDGKVYVFGGRFGSFTDNLGANEEYDVAADEWTMKSPLPTVRSGIASDVVDGKAYVFGGEGAQGTFDTNERYNPRSDEWELMPPMPTARHGLGAVALGNRIYVMAGGRTAGGSDSDLNEVYIVLTGGP